MLENQLFSIEFLLGVYNPYELYLKVLGYEATLIRSCWESLGINLLTDDDRTSKSYRVLESRN